jgi:hypothetical protein
MTDPYSAHLDDETLSAYLDGEAGDQQASAADHLRSCPTCSARLDAFASVAALVRGADESIAPITNVRAEAMVAAAFTTGAGVVVPMRSRRSPAVWLAAAAAAVLLVAGVGSALQRSRSQNQTSALRAVKAPSADTASGAEQLQTTSGAADAGPVNGGDIGDQSNPAEIALLANAALMSSAAATDSSASGAASSAESRSAPPAAGGANAKSGSAPTTTPSAYATVATAQCQTQARALGGDRLATLRYVAALRWKGEPAELLVFDLRPEPSATVTRQAYVLARPGCGVLADPRF